jgi:hypothetical protein
MAENGINCKGGEWRRVEVVQRMIIELPKKGKIMEVVTIIKREEKGSISRMHGCIN